MKKLIAIVLGALAVTGLAQPRLTERSLADIARIAVPANLANEDKITVLAEPSALMVSRLTRAWTAAPRGLGTWL